METVKMDKDMMITIKQAAHILGVGDNTVRRMVRKGKLKQVNEPNPALEKQKVLLDRREVEKLAKPETK